ncbi:head GIN domain-containing protein [Melioribacteraceae bacterium 4301-Me]|uniref:head GIN domain-containing protein n=1 Tax=Pyranulibacter aquaticus TaxID=3163344 RepID=UPI00359B8A00
MKKTSLFFLMLIVVITGCGIWGIRGEGNLIEEKRDITSFNKINVAGAFTIDIIIKEKPSLSISAEENLLRYIKTEVKNGVLYIDTRKNISPIRSIKIYITTPQLNKIISSGANAIFVEGINNENLDIDLSGAGEIKLKGKSQNLKLDLSGVGEVNAQQLNAESVIVRVSGAANAKVYASKYLKASVSGVGSVDFYGNPEKVVSDVSGVGSIHKR